MKRAITLIVLVLVISCISAFWVDGSTSNAETRQTEQISTEISVGAIRWDAWYENPAPESTN